MNDEFREKIMEELKKPVTKEQALEQFKKAGLIPEPIDWAVIKKVLTALKDGPQHSVDCENIRYTPKKFSFTYDEFKKVFRWIEDYAEPRDKIIESAEDRFPTFGAYFTYDGAKYYWNLMIGQGSSISLQYDPKEFDESQFFVLNEAEETVPGYHIRKIKKGKFGEWSKVREEFEECEDAIAQDIKVMVLMELSDLMGAIEAYVRQQHNMSLKDLRKMAKVTSRSFKTGKRK